jgi:hypothetical protein
MYRTQWHNHGCIVKVRPASWSFGLATAQARTRPGASTDSCACNHSRAEYHHLICSWATLLSASAGRPSFDSSLAMTQTTCAAGQFPLHWPIQLAIVQRYDRNRFGWPCLVLCRFSIAVTVQWTTASSSCSDPSEPGACEESTAYVPNFVLLPICLHVYLLGSGC